MKRLFFIFVTVLNLVWQPASAAPQKVAVFELTNKKSVANMISLSPVQLAGITDMLRRSLKEQLKGKFEFISKKTITKKLAGYNQAQADILAKAMRVNASILVSGYIFKFDDKLTVALELHDVEKGESLWKERVIADDIDVLDKPIAQAAQRMGRHLLRSLAAGKPSAAAAGKPKAAPAAKPAHVRMLTNLDAVAKIFEAYASDCGKLAKSLSAFGKAKQKELAELKSMMERYTPEQKKAAQASLKTRMTRIMPKIMGGAMKCSKNPAFLDAMKTLQMR